MDMDEFVWPATSCDPPPFQESSVSTVSHHQRPSLDFMSSDDVPEQWLLGDDDVLDHRRAVQPPPPPPLLVQTTTTTRGTRKLPGPRTDGHVTTSSHVEAERQRRVRLNRRFCDLRAAVPRVTRMDKASILADAVAYIAELRGRVEHLEKASLAPRHASFGIGGHGDHEERFALEARMIGPEAAALRLRTAERHAPARLMAALRALDLPVQHACVCRVGGGVTVQDVVVDVPAAGLRGDGRLRAALHGLLLQESC